MEPESYDPFQGDVPADPTGEELAAIRERLNSSAFALGRVHGFEVADDFERVKGPLLEAVAEVERIADLLSRLSMESAYETPADYWFDVAWHPGIGRVGLWKEAHRRATEANDTEALPYITEERARGFLKRRKDTL